MVLGEQLPLVGLQGRVEKDRNHPPLCYQKPVSVLINNLSPLSPVKSDCIRHPIASKRGLAKNCFALFDQIVDYMAEKKLGQGQSVSYIELYNKVAANHFQ